MTHTRTNRSTWTATGLAALLAGAAPAAAQQPVLPESDPSPPPRVATGPPQAPRQAAAHARYQIRLLEGVLESAVQHGAQVVTMQIRQFSPDLMVFSGPARARGYRLDGYGVFFSVDVPAVRRSVTWSFRTLNQGGNELGRALQSLRRAVATQADSRTRTELEQALRLVELQVGPVPPTPVMPGTPVASAEPAAEVVVTAEPQPVMRDPDAAYEEEVKNALVDAMLDHGSPLDIGAEEWLTVAARDTEDRLMTTDLDDTVTIVLRIRGSDLRAFRAGSLARDDARRRVEVREF